MLSTLKSYVWGAVAAVMALLGVAAWGYRKAAQDERQNAREAEQKAQATQRQREQERDISRAQAEARKEAVSHGEEIRQSEARGDRSHGLSNDRLRDD